MLEWCSVKTIYVKQEENMDWRNKGLIYFSKNIFETNNSLLSRYMFSRILILFPCIKSISCIWTHNIKKNKDIHWIIFIEFKMIKLNICFTRFCDKTVMTPIFRILYAILLSSYQNWYIVSRINRPWTRFILGYPYVINNSMSFIIQSMPFYIQIRQ